MAAQTCTASSKSRQFKAIACISIFWSTAATRNTRSRSFIANTVLKIHIGHIFKYLFLVRPFCTHNLKVIGSNAESVEFKQKMALTVPFLVAGVRFRTHDLRVMREKPKFANFDRKTLQFSKLCELRFRPPKQSAIGKMYSYSISFGGGSQVLFGHFPAFSFAFQSLKLYLPLCRGST